MKKEVIALIVAIVGGVAIYWFTTGLENQRQRNAQRQEGQLQQQREDEARRTKEIEDIKNRPSMSEVEMDINRDGSDYKDFVASNIEECLDTCARELRCKAITFTKSSRQCWMKSSVPLRSNNPNYISAVKVGP